MRKKQFRQGQRFGSFAEFMSAMDRGEWVWWHGRPKHYGFVINLQFFVLRGLVARGVITRALRNEVSP